MDKEKFSGICENIRLVESFNRHEEAEFVASEIRKLEDKWFDPAAYRGETLEHLDGNIYMGNNAKYEITPDGNGIYNAAKQEQTA
jgi:hypothetical protein